jgi:hypothetical protein
MNMNVQPIPFKGISINASKMNGIQESLARSLTRNVMTNQSYVPINKLEMVILPSKAPRSVVVRFLDLISGSFVKSSKRNKPLQMVINDNANRLDAGDKLLDLYSKADKCEKPVANKNKIFNGNTYLQKNLLPESKAEIRDSYQSYLKCLSKEGAKNEALEEYWRTNCLGDKGLNIDF